MAIDGSKFKAVNNRDRNFTSAKMQRRMQQIEESIERYLVATGHRRSAGALERRKLKKRTRLQDKIASLKEQMQQAQGARSADAGYAAFLLVISALASRDR